MKNIELILGKTYPREGQTVTNKVSFSIEFDDMPQALNFMRDLNALVIHFNDNTNKEINNA